MITKRLTPILEKKVGPVTFGMLMRVFRDDLELSQTEFAKKLGIARGTLCDIEKGRQLVSVSLAIRIAHKVKFPVEVAIRACLQDQLNKSGIKMKVELVA